MTQEERIAKTNEFTNMIVDHLNETGFKGDMTLVAIEGVATMYEDALRTRKIIIAKFEGIDKELYFNSRMVYKAFLKTLSPIGIKETEVTEIEVLTATNINMVLNEESNKHKHN